jgi:hypothetical protein
MNCHRCGTFTPRLTLSQRHCPPCARDVLRLIAEDERRRTPRFPIASDRTAWAPR